MATLKIAIRKFDPFESAIRKQFEDFRRATGIEANLYTESLDLNDMHDRLFSRRELADGSFDIAFLSTDWLSEAQSAGLIRDLGPPMAADPIADYPEAWSASLTNLQRFADGYWGIPYHDGPQCLIYRKDLLDAAGLAVPSTWGGFLEAARRLHQPDSDLYGTVLALFPDGHNGFYDFCIHVWTRGGEPFDSEGRPNLVTDEAVAALDFIRDLAKDDKAMAPGARDLDSVKSGLMFCEGRIALMTNWFGFAALGDSIEGPVKGKIDVAPIPSGPNGASVSLNVYWMLTLASGSQNTDLAWAFMRHAASEPMDRITTTEGAIGVRRSTWSDTEINATVPYYRKLDELHQHARELPLHPRLSDIAAAIDVMLGKALDGEAASRDLLKEAQTTIEEIVS